MAKKSELKDAFLLKKEYLGVIQRWTTEQKAELLDAIFEYQTTWDYHTQSDRVEDLMYLIVEYWKSNNEKYDEKCEKNRQIALNRWGKDTNGYERIQTHTNDTDKIRLDKNRIDIEEKEIDKEKETPSKKLFGTIVELTQEEYDRLAAKFWESIIKRYIINMDSYCVEHNKRYKDYNLALQKWIAKDNIKEKPPKDKKLSEFEIEEWVYDLEKMFKT